MKAIPDDPSQILIPQRIEKAGPRSGNLSARQIPADHHYPILTPVGH
jgi:hypothetical protein